ncbi:MAG: NAD-dependent DNA ligase LigA [Saprospiraceae bacterium]|nr:NAD-dependent DNA ligase LigA [Candidatus Vicinibacter affinis]
MVTNDFSNAHFFKELGKQFHSGDAEVLKEKINDLRLLLKYHEWKYYVDNDPVISDFEYDQLYKLLERTESIHPDWITEDSPTQRVSSDLSTRQESVSHLAPMLSLDNTYNLIDLEDFDKRIKKLCSIPENENLEYLVEPKFDGGSMAVVYENDLLVRAATRGDGQKGEEMTPNARTIRSLPLSAPFSSYGIKKAELRGEAIIRKDVFVKINQDREQDGLSLLANPRNAATGVMRTKDPVETASRKLDVFIFQLGFAIDENGENKLLDFKNQEDLIDLVQNLGFLVPKIEKKKCTGIKEVFDFINYWAIKRDSYDYELDGMVIKLNDLGLQEQCGYTAHHPRWAVAYKFQAKQATSVLLQVDFQIGKIGSITPVAKIEPVQLAGVTVSSISLHNEDFIRTKDIFLRDTVLVERAGDVIPYIVKSFPELRGEDATPIVFPSVCPDCKTKLVREEDEAAWRCPNFHCPSQVIQRLIHHVSKDAMNIDGLGASLIERFYELGWIKNMADIYRLDYDAISRLEGMGLKSADKLRMSVSIAKQNPIHRLLHGLCIHHLGKKISKLIAEHLDYVPNLFDWTMENYTAIKDVGPVVGENIIAFFQDPENKKMLKEMELLGVNMLQTEEDKPKLQNQDGVFSGKTILFTGTLSQMDRRKAQELAEKAGAKILSAVSGHLNILVVGTDAGSKLEKAKKIGTVEILTEEEFLSRIG